MLTKAARVIFFADRLAHATSLMLDINALSVCQKNIYQNLILLYKAHTGTAPTIFLISFQRSIISIRQFPKIAAIIQFLNRQWNNKFCNFKERFNPLEYSFRCNTKRNRIFTTIQRYASLTWQRAFVLLMILNLMFFYWNIYFCFHM